jgi:hypothetical protein
MQGILKRTFKGVERWIVCIPLSVNVKLHSGIPNVTVWRVLLTLKGVQTIHRSTLCF